MMTNELTVMEKDEPLVVSSIDVAEMTGKRHTDLMPDIRGYFSVLEMNAKLHLSNFFVEGTYIDGLSRVKPCSSPFCAVFRISFTILRYSSNLTRIS